MAVSPLVLLVLHQLSRGKVKTGGPVARVGKNKKNVPSPDKQREFDYRNKRQKVN